MVQMSRGGITSAFRARIAAGDFGGGRTFPAGTPAVVFSNHGQLEIFLGNLPSFICPNVLLDGFDGRTLGSGWGTVDSGLGLTWSNFFSNNGASSVASGTGKLTLGPSWAAFSNAAAMRVRISGSGPWPPLNLAAGGSSGGSVSDPLGFNEEVNFTCCWKVKPAVQRPGAPINFFIDNTINISNNWLFGFDQNSANSPGLQDGVVAFINTDSGDGLFSNVAFSDPFTLDPNAFYIIAIKVDPENMYARFWADGEAKPGDWQIQIPWKPAFSGAGDFLEVAAFGSITDNGPYTTEQFTDWINFENLTRAA
jgi:hypothetical protein